MEDLISALAAPTRRSFIRTIPRAAAALLPLAAVSLEASSVKRSPADGENAANPGFATFPKEALESLVVSLEASQGTKDLISGKGIALSMTVSAETGKTAKEFEMHEHRDHVFQVLDGTTMYQVGGILKSGRQTKPGEWLAPESEGFRTISLKKGDLLSVPRNTPHRRMTQGKVSLLLISATSAA